MVNQVEDPTLWPKRTDGSTCRGVGLRHRDPADCFLRLKMRTAGQRLGTLHRRFLLIAVILPHAWAGPISAAKSARMTGISHPGQRLHRGFSMTPVFNGCGL
ncbi:hypothetical protein CEE69_30100 [Rhodopirellula bahusiensis]|uniref:Uncharacterized protein n=1 Tax=Rhodopirellula bahusiensis TaxID=2014065 RepID=A0A2G1VXW4_9BACT|nr:hypothetical protein CEE69_30100 [Rhodopirellula bahusiensis]